MNYSQRKHVERLIGDATERNFDPFSLSGTGSLFGMDIIESPDIPRYTLPTEFIPGVPIPAEFRDEFNRWSRSFLGTTNVVPPGMVFAFGNNFVMRPSDVVKISNIT